MKILIIEDEEHAVRHLLRLIEECVDAPNIQSVIDNVEEAVEFLSGNPPLDLIFLDIYLADSISFEIFRQVHVDTPIIFTTAYDEYAIQAFDLNSIDYLLKPIRRENLEKALDKFHRLGNRQNLVLDAGAVRLLTDLIGGPASYKQSFLLSHRERLIPVATDDFAYFEIRNEVVRGVTFEHRQFLMDETLQELDDQLNPATFYRANRQFLVNYRTIVDIEHYFNGRLLLNLEPAPEEKVLISKARAGEFKEWMRSR